MEPTTCGLGIAANSDLPAKLADLLGSIGAVLEYHIKALDPNDAGSQPEIEAYRELVKQHHEAADRLARLADRMAGYEDLPMAKHDVAVLGSSKSFDLLAALVAREEQLIASLQERLSEHRAMLKR